MTMKILFADYCTPEEHAKKELEHHHVPTFSNPKAKYRSWLSTLAEQCINALIVGGCAALSAQAADVSSSWKVGAYAFGLTALFELRKYRKL